MNGLQKILLEIKSDAFNLGFPTASQQSPAAKINIHIVSAPWEWGSPSTLMQMMYYPKPN